MKKTVCLLIFISISALSNAQIDSLKNNNLPQRKYGTYLGTSSGINNINGLLGGILEVQFNEKLTGIGGLGLGLWGVKGSGGLRIYKKYPQSIYYGASLSFYSGIEDFTLTYTDQNTNQDKEVDMDFDNTSTLNFIIGFQWGITQDDRFRVHLEGGYSLPFKKEPYKIKTIEYKYDDDFISMIELISPGGIIFGMGVTMGF